MRYKCKNVPKYWQQFTVNKIGQLKLHRAQLDNTHRFAMTKTVKMAYCNARETTLPVGKCTIRTADSTLFICCPPLPDARQVSMRKSLGLSIMSI